MGALRIVAAQVVHCAEAPEEVTVDVGVLLYRAIRILVFWAVELSTLGSGWSARAVVRIPEVAVYDGRQINFHMVETEGTATPRVRRTWNRCEKTIAQARVSDAPLNAGLGESGDHDGAVPAEAFQHLLEFLDPRSLEQVHVLVLSDE